MEGREKASEPLYTDPTAEQTRAAEPATAERGRAAGGGQLGPASQVLEQLP